MFIKHRHYDFKEYKEIFSIVGNSFVFSYKKWIVQDYSGESKTSMITCELMGGLGNQLFQIFTTISCAIKSKYEFKFLALEKLGGGSSTLRYTYWNSLLYKLKPFLIQELPSDIKVVSEYGFQYNDIPIISYIELWLSLKYL